MRVTDFPIIGVLEGAAAKWDERRGISQKQPLDAQLLNAQITGKRVLHVQLPEEKHWAEVL